MARGRGVGPARGTERQPQNHRHLPPSNSHNNNKQHPTPSALLRRTVPSAHKRCPFGIGCKDRLSHWPLSTTPRSKPCPPLDWHPALRSLLLGEEKWAAHGPGRRGTGEQELFSEWHATETISSSRRCVEDRHAIFEPFHIHLSIITAPPCPYPSVLPTAILVLNRLVCGISDIRLDFP